MPILTSNIAINEYFKTGSLFNKSGSQSLYFLYKMLAIRNIARLTNECSAINKNDKYNENSLFNIINIIIDIKSRNKKFMNVFTILNIFINIMNDININKFATMIIVFTNIFPENTAPKLNK